MTKTERFSKADMTRQFKSSATQRTLIWNVWKKWEMTSIGCSLRWNIQHTCCGWIHSYSNRRESCLNTLLSEHQDLSSCYPRHHHCPRNHHRSLQSLQTAIMSWNVRFASSRWILWTSWSSIAVGTSWRSWRSSSPVWWTSWGAACVTPCSSRSTSCFSTSAASTERSTTSSRRAVSQSFPPVSWLDMKLWKMSKKNSKESGFKSHERKRCLV